MTTGSGAGTARAELQRPGVSARSWAALVALVALVLYWRAPALGFAGDDALIVYHLRRLGGLAHPWALFRIDFFGYYRPVGFLTQAIDASLWRMHPGGFHLTNLLLHAMNGVLVFVLARRLLAPWAAALAAVLFVAHASNQEAVFWISARFDLLATLLVLTTVLLATRPEPRWIWVSLVTFALALLSKEAALATPVIVGAYEVFVRRARPGRVVAILGLMLAVVAGYAAMRSGIGGLDATGGTSRLPKAIMLVGAVVLLAGLARGGWETPLARLSRVSAGCALVLGLALAAMAAGASALLADGAVVREKLSFVGFATFYLLSPVVSPAPPPYFLAPTTPVYWVGGIGAALLVGAALVALRRRLVTDPTWLFLLSFIAAALLPVSSLTEGQRYLYLGSVGVSLTMAKIAADARGRARQSVLVLIAVVLAVSAWQIQRKASDWAWASAMTERAVSLINADLPGRGEGDIVFLVAPVGIRGVYSHFYQQTFSLSGGWEPATFQTLVRMVRLDQPIDVRWISPRTVAIRAPVYRGNFVLSPDLREFRIALRSTRTAELSTPLGLVRSRAEGSGQEVRLELSPSVDVRRLRFYYFTLGEVRPAPPPAEP